MQCLIMFCGTLFLLDYEIVHVCFYHIMLMYSVVYAWCIAVCHNPVFCQNS